MRRALILATSLISACGSCSDDEPTGPVTVRQITEQSQLIEGLEATGRVGDYVLDNGQARFIVQQPGSSTGWSLYGGSLVDLQATAGTELFEELFVQCDLRAFKPEKAEIVDGTTLRLTGPDAGLPFVDAIIGESLDVTMTVDFILPPEGRTLELAIRVKDERKTRAREIQCGLMVLPGDAYVLTSPQTEYGETIGGNLDYLAASAPDASTSWVLHRPEAAPVSILIGLLPVIPIAGDAIPFLANATIEERYFISLGDKGDVASALAERARMVPGTDGPRDVRIDVTAPVPLGSLSVAIIDGSGRGVTTANGELTFRVPPGTYDARLTSDGRQIGRFDIEVPAGDDLHVVDHAVSDVGVLRVRSVSIGLDGAEEGPTPVRLRIAQGAGGTAAGSAFYQDYVPADAEVRLPAGEYTVVATRGPEHEAFVADATIVAGETTETNVRVVRVVDTSGWTSADLHVHGTRSTDSEVSRRLRVLGAAAEGLDILISSDHDTVTDYGPTVEALGLGAQLRTAPGIEMSMLYGHMNGYPVQAAVPQDTWRPGWFVFDDVGSFVRSLDPHEVAESLRGGGAKVVQINHPRDGGGVFGHLGLDANGETELPWPDADAAEILNGKRIEDYEQVVVDVYRLIENGRRVTGVGTSDIHSNFGIGYARTYVRTSGSMDDYYTGLAAGHAVAANGPFVEASIAGGGPGDTVTAMGPVGIDVRIQAPSWMSVETLRIIENGTAIAELTIDPSTDVVRFDGTITATVTSDSYYFVEVRGGNSPPLLSETITVVNPVYVDADGDGWRFR